MDPLKREAALKEARVHLEFVVSLYKLQIDEGRYFLHEHPWGAKSWHEPCIKELMKEPSVKVVRGDMCKHV